MSVSASAVPELNKTNWTSWSSRMTARLRQLGLWRIIDESWEQPKLDLIVATKDADGKVIALTAEQQLVNTKIKLDHGASLKRYLLAKEKAASNIYTHLSPSQRTLVCTYEEDPAAMWGKLLKIHNQQVPGMRFGAYNALFSIVQQPDESLQAVAGRASEALTRVQELHLDSFTIAMLDDELAIMAMLCALPCKHYGKFVSALMRQKDLKRADVEAAFQVKQVERTAHHSPLVSSAALCTFGKPSSPRGDLNKCPFCSIEGHVQDDCYKYKSACTDAHKLVNERKVDTCDGGNKRRGKANCAKVEEEEVVEKAQRAQVRLAAAPSSSADAYWIADTGATSHMTPHQSWFTSYRPHVVPFHVANTALCPCRLLQVLHVPELQNNLFAVLHLTLHHEFRMVIEGSQLQFSQQGALCLTATVKDGTAYMDVKVAAVTEAALASRAPLTRSLWHRCLVHIGEAKIEQALKHALARGLKADCDNPIPHICVPCVHGKQHCDPFPAKASHRSKTPFERIHSDLHEVPCLTSSGYRYWLTFIDNCSRYAWIYLFKRKSEAFDAFKLFKVMVEKQYNAVIRFFHEDKGGEYIGHKWDAFCGEYGIWCKHTTRATPQQNGVAECQNRTLAEIVTAMLNEAKLPKSFWGEALATANKVLNMLPSAALPPDTTPYEIIKKHKPDYAPLRVFGYRAFVHVSKGKRKSLDLHTTPCVFLGYPEDYCGWKLWDPCAKQVIISHDVIWNEEEMPGNSTTPVLLLSVLEYADQEEAPTPNPDDPASPMEGPDAPAHPEEPVAAAAPQPKRQASAEPAEQPVTPPCALHDKIRLSERSRRPAGVR
jgi:transposase InsO family protein